MSFATMSHQFDSGILHQIPMREVPIRILQQNPGKQTDELPFLITKHGKPIAKVVPTDTPYPGTRGETDEKAILQEVIDMGLDQLRNTRTRVGHMLLMKALDRMEKLKKEEERQDALEEATEEVFS